MRAALPLLFLLVVGTASAAEWQFTRTLQFGARGPEVFALQKILNGNPATRVALSGAGSPGNETSYFGPATARAVAAFQRENTIAGEAGRVGVRTQEALNRKITTNISTKNIPRPDQKRRDTPLKGGVGIPQSSPLEGSTPTPVGGRDVSGKTGGEAEITHPNERNLAEFLDTVRRVGAEQGYGTEKLETLTNEMRTYALATTTDFLSQFVAENRAKKISGAPTLRTRVSALLAELGSMWAPRAEAQIPSFGGMVVYVFPCTCSGNWLVGMVPLSVPPIALITHYSGIQTYLNFNAPFTLFMLGSYIPQGVPCLFYAAVTCVSLPSQAQTMPMLGTS